MRVFICGGGSGEQTVRALHRLNEVIDHTLPCLYIPLAMEEEQYDSCRQWITGELSDMEIPGIEMVRSAEELSRKHLANYSFLFIGGGNTFKLLYDIKRVNMFEPIREYLQNGGVAFGGSAGAIIFGEDLEACALDDENEVGLKDTEGFDVLGGISFLCHFTNRTSEQDRRSEAYLLKISEHRKVCALPEEDTLFVNDSQVEAIIDRPYYIFENGRRTEVPVTDHSRPGTVKTASGAQAVLLNGPSSSGKSTLAKALQTLIESRRYGRYEVVSIDDFMKGSSNETIYEDDVYEISGDMCEKALEILGSGAGVIIDHVITSERIFRQLTEALSAYPLRMVNITCPLNVLRERERMRGDRCPGSAEASSKYLYPKDGYELTIDTSRRTQAESALQIFEILI